jgi:exosortase K
MQFVRSAWNWYTLSWWLAVLGVALALKYHYSVAVAAELEWMFRPLSLLLEWFSGHPFYRDSNHEWVSETADVRLVKACAGINFLLMSLVAYGWMLRPGHHPESAAPVWMARRFLLLCTAIVAAWATGLLANSLRIIILMKLDPQGAELHRLTGMLVYVPVLSLQLALGGRRDWREVLAGPVLLYLLLTVAVPLLTGNALMNPALFTNHLLYVLVMMAVMCSIYCVFKSRSEPIQTTYDTSMHPGIGRNSA